MKKGTLPRVESELRSHIICIPEEIHKATGIVILGRRIKSVIFTTDLALIRNTNADAVLAVYPFTPQQVISHAIISASSIPVFCGVGGGLTRGDRCVMLAKDAEAQGAMGVVLNVPTENDVIRNIRQIIDIPIVVTVISENTDVASRIEAGASILNVSASTRTAEVVAKIRGEYPNIPIIATGGPTPQSILEVIEAGANTISFTPPTTKSLFKDIMEKYRDNGL